MYLGKDPTAVPKTAGTFVTESQYTPNLTTPGIYYLRIQAEDMTGNIDSNIFAPFIYKFDNVPPDNPNFVTVTPSGFTSINNYTFQWPNAYDGDSGIDEYCYHTGANSGPFSVETCQKEKSLVDVAAAYLNGTNVFSLRVRDIAGNYATSYTEASFYYTTDPPSPVTNLRAIPPTSTENLFTFLWDLPATFAGDANQLTYCYSINVLPSPINTTCTNDRYIPAFKAATQKGTNIIYVVAKDEANNVNWNNYASSNFIANTVSPGIPLNLVVSDTSDRAAGRWSLTLTWDKPIFEGNGIDHYIVERSTDNHTFENIGSVSTMAFVDMFAEPDTTYYYRVRASDDVDNVGGPSGTVAQSAKGRFVVPPQIVSAPVVKTSFDRATISWVTERESTSFVYYGTSPTDLGQSKGSLGSTTEHNMTITGLEPSSVYYFKVQSFDNDRNYSLQDAYSQIYTFRTTETARIFNVKTSDISLGSALLSWQTSVPTKFRIEYGKNQDYGLYQDSDSGYGASNIFKLSNLNSGTTYHFRIAAITEYGSTLYSDDYAFDTLPYPTISNISFQPIQDATSIGVKINWNTNVPTSSVVTYQALSVSDETANVDLVTNHEIIINDLAASSEYEFFIKGRDAYGNLANSDKQTWSSPVDTRDPAISNLSVDVATTEVWGNAKAQLIVSWKTDEPSTTQVKYGDSVRGELDKETAFDSEPTVNHVAVISNLELSKVYRIQPVSKDISGNTVYGNELSAVTPDKEETLLDIILNSLSKVFGG